MSFPAIYLGDFSGPRTGFLALVPPDAASGENIRAIRLIAGERLAPDAQNYWLLQIGILTAQGLKVVAQASLADGFSVGVVRTIGFPSPLAVARGDLLGYRLSQSGAPAPISGLSAIIEWGILSTNRAAR